MKKHLILFIPLIFLFPAVSNADKSPTEKTADDQIVEKYNKVAVKKDKVICRYVRKTGSHFKTRICRTVAQIEDERQRALREHGDALSGGMSGNAEN